MADFNLDNTYRILEYVLEDFWVCCTNKFTTRNILHLTELTIN